LTIENVFNRQKQRCLSFLLVCVFIATCLFPPLSFAAIDFPFLKQSSQFFRGFSDDLETSGYLKNETAYRFREPRSYTKIKNFVYFDSRYTPNDWAKMVFVGRAYYDLVYDMFEYDTISARNKRDIDQPLAFVENLSKEKDSPVAEIRELYVQLENDNMDVRIGKQFVIWGVLTGVRVVDEMNPMNFREFITPALLDYRTPLWSMKSNFYFGDSSSFQLLWIPEMRFHEPAPPGSEWELFQTVPGTQYPKSFVLGNSEVGLKLETTVKDAAVSLSYFSTWDDFPVLFRDAKVATSGVIEDPTFYPRYRRMRMFGSTLDMPLMGQVLKMEAAYVLGKYFGLKAVDRDGDGKLDNQGVLRRSHIRLGAGMDFNFLRTEVSPSVTQWIIRNYDTAILQDKFDTSVNLFLRKTFLKRNTAFELLAIYLLNFDELYLKPKLSFSPASTFQVSVGLDLFYGQMSRFGVIARDGKPTELILIEQRARFIGNFSGNDRIFTEFKYSF